MKYAWRDGARVKGVDAQAVGERLETLRSQQHGLVTPAAVVDDARPEDSPLHAAFLWDDSLAAEEHRRQQARHLVGGLRVVVESNEAPKSSRAFVHVTVDKNEGYVAISAAMNDNTLREQVLRRAWTELESWRARYNELTEMARVLQAIEEVQADLQLA